MFRKVTPSLSPGRLKTTIIALGCVLYVSLSLVMWARHSHRSAPALSTQSIGGPFTLVTSASDVVTDQSYRGKWKIVYFGYTYCPDVCPMTLRSLSDALNWLGPLSATTAPLFITLDPKRDTPIAMGAYLKNFDSRIIGLTGTDAQIDEVAKSYRVFHSLYRTGAGPNDYVVDHSSLIYVMNPDGKFAGAFSSEISGDAMAAQIRQFIDNAS